MNSALVKLLHPIKQVALAVSFHQKRRDRIIAANRAALHNQEPSIIASNCTGGIMYHELGLQFRSQFINLFLMAEDFVKYLGDFDRYNAIDKIEYDAYTSKEAGYPVGIIDDIRVFFVHYKTIEEAQRIWNERKKRLNKDNLFIIFSEQDGCTKKMLEAFSRLPYQNKVAFTKKEYPDIPGTYYIKEFEKNEIGVFAYRSQLSAVRIIDAFPLVSWLNGEYDVK